MSNNDYVNMNRIKRFLQRFTGVRYIHKWQHLFMSYIVSIKQFRALKYSFKSKRFRMLWKERKLCLSDRTQNTAFDPHYLLHTAWAARILAQTKPTYHIDISSSLFFNAIVSAFIPIKFYDFRPANLKLDNFTSESADITKLNFHDSSIMSISCMHVIEHIGLGRYGDPINPDGDLNAINELKRVLAPGGSILFVVPIGKPRIEFNAHRVYSYDQIMSYFKEINLMEFSLIPDDGYGELIIKNPTKQIADAQNYGCGCFWFKK